MSELRFSGAVLAGGRSTRMGRDKAFLTLGGETLLGRQLRLLRECGAEETLISGRNGVDYSAFAAKAVYDGKPDSGPLAGVAAVLEAACCPMVLILAADMPAMTAAMLGKILSGCGENTGCAPFGETGFEPLAAAYPRTALPLARRHLAKGRYAMREFVEEAVAEGLMNTLEMQPEDRASFANWNRPSDLDDPAA